MGQTAGECQGDATSSIGLGGWIGQIAGGCRSARPARWPERLGYWIRHAVGRATKPESPEGRMDQEGGKCLTVGRAGKPEGAEPLGGPDCRVSQTSGWARLSNAQDSRMGRIVGGATQPATSRRSVKPNGRMGLEAGRRRAERPTGLPDVPDSRRMLDSRMGQTAGKRQASC